MMLPGMQCWPPYSLIPSLFECESLLFCVEPPCFLDALRHQYAFQQGDMVEDLLSYALNYTIDAESG